MFPRQLKTLYMFVWFNFKFSHKPYNSNLLIMFFKNFISFDFSMDLPDILRDELKISTYIVRPN